MNICKINGINFDVKVAISSIEENFNVLDGPNAGRVMAGDMVRDVIGTFIGHKVTFFNGNNNAAFDELWDFLVACSVDGSVLVEMADGQSSIKYEAYYTSGSRKLKRSSESGNVWDEIEITFIPISAQVTP